MRLPLGRKNLEVNGQGGAASAPAMPAQGQGAPMVLNALGQQVMPSVTDTSGSNQKVQDPRYEAARAAQRQAFDRQAAGVQAQADLNVQAAEKMAPYQEAEMQRRMAERSALIARQAAIQQEIEAKHKEHNERVQRVLDYSPGGFWDNKTDEQKARVRIGIWLSAIGGGLAKQDSRAMEYINKAIERDTEAKKQRGELLMKQAEKAEGAYKTALESRGKDLADYRANNEAMFKDLADYAEMYKNTMLPQQLRAQADEKVGALRAEQAKANMDALRAYEVDVHSQHSVVQPTNMNQSAGGGTKDIKEVSKADYQGQLADEAEELIKENGLPTSKDIRQIEADAMRANRNSETARASVAAQTAIGLGKEYAPGFFPRTEYTNVSPKVAQTHSRLYEMVEQQVTDDLGSRAVGNPDLIKGEIRRRMPNADDPTPEAEKKAAAIIARGRHMRDIAAGTSGARKIQAADAAREGAASAPTTTAQPNPMARPSRDAMIEKARAAVKAGGAGAKSAKAFLERQGVKP